jgi:hypothetical protein
MIPFVYPVPYRVVASLAERKVISATSRTGSVSNSNTLSRKDPSKRSAGSTPP